MLSTIENFQSSVSRHQQSIQEKMANQENIIAEVQKICEARLAYNNSVLRLLDADSNATHDFLLDALKHIVRLSGQSQSWTEEALESKLIETNSIALNGPTFREGCENDRIPYQAAIQIIQTNLRTQQKIDNLYVYFFTENKRISVQGHFGDEEQSEDDNNLSEAVFCRKIQSLLKREKSILAADFLKYHKMLYIQQSDTYCWEINPTRLLEEEKEINRFIKTITHKKAKLLNEIHQFQELSDIAILFENFDEETKKASSFSKVIQDPVPMQAADPMKGFNPLKGFEDFSDFYENYVKLQELDKIIERFLYLIEEIKTAKKRLAKKEKSVFEQSKRKPKESREKPKKTPKKNQPHHATSSDALLETPNATKETEPLKTQGEAPESSSQSALVTQEASQTLTEAQQRALDYKREVLQARADKKAADGMLKRFTIAKNVEKMRAEQSREKRGEALLKLIAFQRLEGLSSDNLDRLSRILSTDGSIRYAEVQALIGQTPTQLKGSITAGQGGSHRTITLDAVKDSPDLIGCFNEFTDFTIQIAQQPERAHTAQEESMVFSTEARAFSHVRGGMPQEHGGAHAGKISPATKKMLGEIFERGAITAERLEQFKSAQSICSEQGIENPTLEQLMHATTDSNALRLGL